VPEDDRSKWLYDPSEEVKLEEGGEGEEGG
jgi:hypothetical protein